MNISYKFINNLFELSSKSKTLSHIKKYFIDIDIADLIFFTKNEWIKYQSNCLKKNKQKYKSNL